MRRSLDLATGRPAQRATRPLARPQSARSSMPPMATPHNRPLVGRLLLGSVLSLACWAGGIVRPATGTAAPPDFNRQVRPLLAQYCFKCHGPDDQTREAGLRLDSRDGAIRTLESGVSAIVPGQVSASELIRRIRSTDPDTQMPPPATKKQLTAADQQILEQWIAAGAPYQPHWAFIAPRPTPLPAVQHTAWPRSPLDTLVLRRLEETQLAPSPPADRYTLARRMSLDLLGVPPSLDDVEDFVADPGPDAADRYLDRLLATPRYGERWARRWLDLARYADTNGYEKDRPRSIWPYRDWVIRQLNADLPFDQFTIEQIAGDMLPNATLEQRIATGFHRNTMINEEGGIDPLEFRFHAMVDRLNTTGTVWLGLTLVCASCHTHKFDPIPQTEYYRMFALLNNADEPEIAVSSPALEQQRAEVERQIATLEAALPEKFPPAGDLRWTTPKLVSAQTASDSRLVPQPDGSLLAEGIVPAADSYTLVFDSDARDITTLRLEALTHPSLGGGGPGRTPHGNFVLGELEIKAAPRSQPEAAVPVKIASGTADIEQTGFPVANAFDGDPQTGWAIHAEGQPLNRDRAATFTLAQPVGHDGGTRWTLVLRQSFGKHHVLGRCRITLGQRQSDDRPLAVRRQAHLEQRYQEWLADQSRRSVSWTALRPVAARSNLPLLTILDDGSVLASGDQSKSDTYELTFDGVPAGITALRLEALPDDRLPKQGPGRVYYEGPPGDFFLSHISAATAVPAPAAGAPPLIERPFARASHSFANGGNGAAAAIDDNKQTGWSINGGQGRAHTAVFHWSEPTPAAGGLVVKLLFERYYAAGLGRFRISVTSDPRAEARDLPPELEAALALPEAQRTDEQRAQLRRRFLATAPELAAEHQAIERLRQQLPTAPTTLVFVERPSNAPRPTHRYHRGEFLQPKELVQPGVLSLLPGLPSAAPANRLSLARWLVSPENPLVGRVTMNRQWAALFGRGIVRTTEDFGYQGEPPTHPEVLDWLALEFVRQGWSLKRMHRAMVSSATYGQSAQVSATLLARDPRNELLGRSPRFRLEAELLRDSVLQISELATWRIGGPSVFPPQPSNVTTEGAYGALSWKTSEGSDRYRRGLYTFTKRTAPYAMFTTFDAPSGEACVARRELSNTPLQALTLLNDTVFLEGAQALGRQLVAGPPADFVPTIWDQGKAVVLSSASPETTRAVYLFRRCVLRPPTSTELAQIEQFYGTQVSRLKARELEAARLAGPGAGDEIQRAAWTATARVLLNLDEVVTRE
ncbi:MAG: PSD1 and planctomycete cytochrome C domain-containing protein [Pirellulales bacterium]